MSWCLLQESNPLPFSFYLWGGSNRDVLPGQRTLSNEVNMIALFATGINFSKKYCYVFLIRCNFFGSFRNLFFRTSYLLLLGVKPIFVLEGRAPTLKHNTIARRREQATKSSQESKSNNGNRGRLTGLQKKVGYSTLFTYGTRYPRSRSSYQVLLIELKILN